jgi:hypothetical protein
MDGSLFNHGDQATGNLRPIQEQLNNLMKTQEDSLRDQKKTSAFVYGWPHECFPFKELRSAASKLIVVQRFFSEVLQIPNTIRQSIDIRSIFVKKGGNGHVIVNFVRETDKEKVNPFLKNLKNFNQRRGNHVPTIWRDDLTKQQMDLKKMVQKRRLAAVLSTKESSDTAVAKEKENIPNNETSFLVRRPINVASCSVEERSALVDPIGVHRKAARFIDAHCHLDVLFDKEHFGDSFLQYKYKHIDTWGAGFDGKLNVCFFVLP